MKKFLFAIAALAMTLTASAQSVTESATLKMSMSLDKAISTSANSTLTVKAKDSNPDEKWTVINMTLHAPAGVKVALNSKGTKNLVSLNSTRFEDTDYSISSNQLAEDASAYDSSKPSKINIIIMSLSKGDYVYNTASDVEDLFTVQFIGTEGFTNGDITVDEIKFVHEDNTAVYPSKVDPTAVSEVNAEVKANEDGKFIENGQVVVVKNSKKYNAAGARIK